MPLYVMTEHQLREVVYQCSGAATQPLMEDHPDYVFPSERVAASVEHAFVDLAQRVPVAPDALSKQEVITYLDEAIRMWRGIRDGTVEPQNAMTAEPLDPVEVRKVAPCYVDAFQSARISLVGELLA